MQNTRAILTLFLSLSFCSLYAQDFFEGSLHFTVSLEGAGAKQILENNPNNKMTMHIKDGDYIVQVLGGDFPKQFLFIADSNFEYSMDMVNQKAYRYSPHSDQNRASAKEEVKAVPTGKQQEVNDILCDEYVLRKATTVFYYYVHDDYRVNVAAFPKKCRAKASFLAQGLEGRIPLKTIKKQEGLIVKTELKQLSSREFEKEQFMIPTDFEVRNRDYRY